MFSIVGLGLNEKGYSREAYDSIMKSKKIYIDNYTVDFPYKIENLQKQLKKKFVLADREFIERFKILDDAKKQNVVLLVYGSPLTATTHISLIEEAKKRKIKCQIIHGASIFDAVAETGLHLYKFGKITSMPKWQKNFTPESFMEIVRQNESIKAHTLILVDISLKFSDALRQLEIAARNRKVKFDKIIVCQSMGTKNQKILHKKFEGLRNLENIKNPFCFIIPSDLHFTEKEVLEEF